jgi:ribose-phosphate pyrophosphokinase
MGDLMGQHHPLRIFSGSANRPLAESVAALLDIQLGRCTTVSLKDTEIHVTIDEAVRDQDVFIVQPCSRPVNDNLMELMFYIDAFRRASAHEITAVIPYYPYGRQERMARGREAISAKVVAAMLERMGVGRVLYFDVHAPATQGFFDVPVDPLSALPVFVEYLNKPEFAHAAIVVMHKRRESFTETGVSHVVGNIEGKIPIIIDDVIASGSVLQEVDSLFAAGAREEAYLAITHGVLLDSALQRLEDPRIKCLIISDTICQPPVIRNHPKIKVVSIARLLADVIFRIHEGQSISSLMDKAKV